MSYETLFFSAVSPPIVPATPTSTPSNQRRLSSNRGNHHSIEHISEEATTSFEDEAELDLVVEEDEEEEEEEEVTHMSSDRLLVPKYDGSMETFARRRNVEVEPVFDPDRIKESGQPR